MTTYKLVVSLGQMFVIKDGVSVIPFDDTNTDYQQYLKFLEDGGQPLPADNNG